MCVSLRRDWNGMLARNINKVYRYHYLEELWITPICRNIERHICDKMDLNDKEAALPAPQRCDLMGWGILEPSPKLCAN